MLQNSPGGKTWKWTFLEVSNIPGLLSCAACCLVSLRAITLVVAVLVSLSRMVTFQSKYSWTAWSSRILKIGLAIFVTNFSSESDLKISQMLQNPSRRKRPEINFSPATNQTANRDRSANTKRNKITNSDEDS